MGGLLHVNKLFRDERGVTTAGMAVSLMLAVALMFSGAQLYRTHSVAAEVQEVADVCALAAENQVAGLTVIADTCDAVCLSMTLLSATLFGLGIVAACVPPCAGLSAKLIELAGKTVDARQKFYERACKGLNAAQRALPFLALCNAMRVGEANSSNSKQTRYVAGAVLVPADFAPLGSAVQDGLEETADVIESSTDDIREKAEEAEKAACAANDAKERGYMEDCGRDPAYCMRERAEALAHLPGWNNPAYASVDAWSFSVGLERARAYYQQRLAQWRIAGRSTEAKADSVIRKRFYEYAISELKDAYVHDGPDGFSARLPHFFRNTNELRETTLYMERVYPITEGNGQRVMHAWSGCARAKNASSFGSVQDLERARGEFETCELCKFVPSSVGSVASASTSISNGFENHYELMRQACEDYAKARAESDPVSQDVKNSVSKLLEMLKEVLRNAGKFRIHIEPPGRFGALALVANVAPSQTDAGFQSTFVPGSEIGVRAAVSAATLVDDSSESAGAIVTETVKTVLPSGPTGVGVGSIAASVTGVWMGMLRAYEDGQAGLVQAVKKGLGGFSHTSASGIGAWASDALMSAIKSVGLEPANTHCRKPVVLNTQHVAAADESSIGVTFMKAKAAAQASSTPRTSSLSALIAGAVHALDERTNGVLLTIASIELPFGNGGCMQWVVPDADKSESTTVGSLAEGIASPVLGLLERERIWQ